MAPPLFVCLPCLRVSGIDRHLCITSSGDPSTSLSGLLSTHSLCVPSLCRLKPFMLCRIRALCLPSLVPALPPCPASHGASCNRPSPRPASYSASDHPICILHILPHQSITRLISLKVIHRKGLSPSVASGSSFFPTGALSGIVCGATKDRNHSRLVYMYLYGVSGVLYRWAYQVCGRQQAEQDAHRGRHRRGRREMSAP